MRPVLTGIRGSQLATDWQLSRLRRETHRRQEMDRLGYLLDVQQPSRAISKVNIRNPTFGRRRQRRRGVFEETVDWIAARPDLGELFQCS